MARIPGRISANINRAVDTSGAREDFMAKTAAALLEPPTTYSEIDLSGEFALTSPARKVNAKTIALPGDVHTALLDAGDIPDPYFGANEQAVMWVHATPWTMERRFTAKPADTDGYLTL